MFSRDCSACHTLTGHDIPDRQGGDLRRVRISRAAMVQFTREMPVAHRITAPELRAVVTYVLAAEAAAH